MHSVKLEWSILYIEGSNIVFPSQETDFVLHVANSADADEMSHYAAFHLGLHYLIKYPFGSFWSSTWCYAFFVLCFLLGL